MSPRQTRVEKAERYCNTDNEACIERIRRARALGCDLSYLGIDSQASRKPVSNRMSLLIPR